MKYLWIATLLLAAASFAQVNAVGPPSVAGIGIKPHLNGPVPLNASFVDEDGAEVTLGSFFGQRPVLLVPVYYTCQMLCSQTLHGVLGALRPLSLLPGRDFEIVVFSFDPADTTETAREMRDRYATLYSSYRGDAGWHFLTGPENSIRALTDAIGFHYRYDAADKMYIHQSGVMVITPAGRVARYFYGVDYEPKDLKLGLVEASNGRIGSAVDRVLLYCYHYDPKTGKYGAVVINMLRGAGIVMLLTMAVVLGVFWKADLARDSANGGRKA